jgi:hypothetical protein
MGLVCLQIWIGTLIVASSILFFLSFTKPNDGLPNLPREPMWQLIFSTTMVSAREIQYNPNVIRLVGHINDEPTINRFKKSTHETL